MFLHKILLFYSAHNTSSASLILLHLVNSWRSGTASNSMFDFR